MNRVYSLIWYNILKNLCFDTKTLLFQNMTKEFFSRTLISWNNVYLPSVIRVVPWRISLKVPIFFYLFFSSWKPFRTWSAYLDIAQLDFRTCLFLQTDWMGPPAKFLVIHLEKKNRMHGISDWKNPVSYLHNIILYNINEWNIWTFDYHREQIEYQVEVYIKLKYFKSTYYVLIKPLSFNSV